MKLRLLSLFFILGIGQSISAQVYPSIGFETNNTTPTTKAYNSNDTVTANGIKWTMPGVRLGAADNSDFKFDDRSARLGKENETSGYNGCMIMQQDLAFGLHDLYFWAAMNGSQTGGKVDVSYSTDGGVNWNTTDTFNIPANNQPELFNVHQHITGNVRMKICKNDAGSGIINIDSIYFKEMAIPPATLDLALKTPTGNNVNPYLTDSLVLYYNQHVEPLTGNLYLIEENGPTLTFSATSPNVSITAEQIKISNIALLPNKKYDVLVDAGFVESEYAQLPNDAIVANEWFFNTNMGAYDSFHIATTSACSNTDTFDQVLVRKNVLGTTDYWQCNQENNTTYYSMKGTGTTNYDANEDWLVTVFPTRISDSTILSFDETRLGVGSNTERGVYYSTQYKGSVNTVIWTKLVDLPAIADNATATRTINLTNIPDLAYIAFKYSNLQSNISQPFEWQLRNIELKQIAPVSVQAINHNPFQATIIGQSTASNILLNIQLEKNQTLQFEWYDINGRNINTSTRMLDSGMQQINFNNIVSSAGFYLLKITNGQQQMTIKVPVAY